MRCTQLDKYPCLAKELGLRSLHVSNCESEVGSRVRVSRDKLQRLLHHSLALERQECIHLDGILVHAPTVASHRPLEVLQRILQQFDCGIRCLLCDCTLLSLLLFLRCFLKSPVPLIFGREPLFFLFLPLGLQLVL